jgi:hypothetical protein
VFDSDFSSICQERSMSVLSVREGDRGRINIENQNVERRENNIPIRR